MHTVESTIEYVVDYFIRGLVIESIQDEDLSVAIAGCVSFETLERKAGAIRRDLVNVLCDELHRLGCMNDVIKSKLDS